MSRFYDDGRAQSRGPMFTDPYGRGFTIVPTATPFDDRDFPRVNGAWGAPPPAMAPPQMPFYGGAGGGGQSFYGGGGGGAGGFPAGNANFIGGGDRFVHPLDRPLERPIERPGFSMGRPGSTMRSGYGLSFEGGRPHESHWERDRGRGYNQPMLDFPPDPDVRGFDEYKRRWDDTEPKSRAPIIKDAQGWGPEPEVKYDPLLMWSDKPEPSNSELLRIKQEAQGDDFKRDDFKRLYEYPDFLQERRNRFESSEAHVPPAYDRVANATNGDNVPIPPMVGPIGTHGRAYPDRDRSLSPARPTYPTLRDELGVGRYKREDRFDF